MQEDGLKSPVAKFFSEEQLEALRAALGAEEGDWMFFVADKNPVVFESLNRLRLHFRDRLGLADPDVLGMCWVTDFPLFEWNEEEGRIEPMHHMFTMPREEDVALLDSEPLRVIGQLYDLVANGTELASGSIRIHRPDLQQKVFDVIGIGPEEANRRFGTILTAFRYGAPPHGGIAPGVDRLRHAPGRPAEHPRGDGFPQDPGRPRRDDGRPRPGLRRAAEGAEHLAAPPPRRRTWLRPRIPPRRRQQLRRCGTAIATAPIALTFDDGPDPVWTPLVLDALALANARATFFVVAPRARALTPPSWPACGRKGTT